MQETVYDPHASFYFGVSPSFEQLLSLSPNLFEVMSVICMLLVLSSYEEKDI